MYPGRPYIMSESPWSMRRHAPQLGQHNEEIYCEMLGYSRQELVVLYQVGVI
jgi:crotonobetainyl-CoA:carnitine CoA-transferase CaiB-like acyl-CoA transferase